MNRLTKVTGHTVITINHEIDDDDDKYRKYNSKQLIKMTIIRVLIVIATIYFVRGLELSIYFEAYFENLAVDENVFDMNKTMVMIAATKSFGARYENAKQNCEYFILNGVDCVIFDAFDGRKLLGNNKTNVMNDLIGNGLLPASKQKLDVMNKKGVGGMACAITKTMVYKTLMTQKYYNQYQYVMIAEDDAIFPLDFVKNLKISMNQLSKHRVSRNWDLVNLFPCYWCSFVDTKNKKLQFHRVHLQRMSENLYRYHQIQPFSVEFFAGFAMTTATIMKIESIKEKIVPNLPIDMFQDLWLAEFIKKRELNAFTFCPPLIKHGKFNSSIRNLAKLD